MKHLLIFTISACLIYSCVYKNEEDSYYSTSNNGKNTLDSGLIAHFCFQNSLVDSSKNNISLTLHGAVVYDNNSEYGSGNMAIRLNGLDNYFEIPVGHLDTVSISMFFIGDGALSSTQKPYLLDYGQEALDLHLDAVSGGTYITVNNETLNNPQENWISSYDGWNFLYVEAIISSKQFKIVTASHKKPSLTINSSISNSIAVQNNILVIGRGSLNSSAGAYFKGLIDDVRIYNRKLTTNELHQISKVL